MSGIFLKLLNLSISVSWLVLVVLALRLVLKRAPKWVNVLLWGMVALRLMLPFSIESALSLIPSAETFSPEVVRFDPAPTITSGVTIIDKAPVVGITGGAIALPPRRWQASTRSMCGPISRAGCGSSASRRCCSMRS